MCHWHCLSLFDLPEEFTRLDKLCDCLKTQIQASLFKGLPASLSFKWFGLRDLERLGEEAHVVAQPSAKDLAKAAKLQAKEEQRAAKRQKMERLRDEKKQKAAQAAAAKSKQRRPSTGGPGPDDEDAEEKPRLRPF